MASACDGSVSGPQALSVSPDRRGTAPRLVRRQRPTLAAQREPDPQGGPAGSWMSRSRESCVSHSHSGSIGRTGAPTGVSEAVTVKLIRESPRSVAQELRFLLHHQQGEARCPGETPKIYDSGLNFQPIGLAHRATSDKMGHTAFLFSTSASNAPGRLCRRTTSLSRLRFCQR